MHDFFVLAFLQLFMAEFTVISCINAKTFTLKITLILFNFITVIFYSVNARFNKSAVKLFTAIKMWSYYLTDYICTNDIFFQEVHDQLLQA